MGGLPILKSETANMVTVKDTANTTERPASMTERAVSTTEKAEANTEKNTRKRIPARVVNAA